MQNSISLIIVFFKIRILEGGLNLLKEKNELYYLETISLLKKVKNKLSLSLLNSSNKDANLK